jgi:hypothetical protein
VLFNAYLSGIHSLTVTNVNSVYKVIKHNIYNGFETGQFFQVNGTFYYTANELGMCKGVLWDLVTRAAIWSAPASNGPWSRAR